jgi:ribonucleoside-triphosphate reductase
MVVAGSGANVVKSSGETEIFDPNIITSDCVEAGVEFWTAADVTLEVSKEVYDGINSDEIQRKIMSALYNRNPEVAERYKRFHSMYVRTSSNTIERFNRKRIVDSLVKETTLPKEVAESVARETESELRRLNLDFTSGPLIREIVNVKLLEHGYEGARSDYTRLGMPVYDAAQFIESGAGQTGNPEVVHKEMANSIFTEYSLLKVLPLHLADAHMKGGLHIHCLEYFVTRPYTAIHDLRFILKNGLRFYGTQPRSTAAGPAKKPYTAALHAIKALMAFNSNFSSTQGLHSFNVWLAPYLEGLNPSEVKQLAQTCLFEILQTSSLGGQSTAQVDLEIEYGIPDSYKRIPAVLPGGKVKNGVFYSDFEDESIEFAKALTEKYNTGDYTGSAFNSPRLIYKLRGEDQIKDGYESFMGLVHETAANKRAVNILNLSTGSLGPVTFSHSSGLIFQSSKKDQKDLVERSLNHSSLQCTTLNLPRAVYKSGGKEDRLFEIIRETVGLAREVAVVKKDVISRRMKRGSLPFLSQEADNRQYYDLERTSNLLSYVGLNEAVKAYLGEEMHVSSYALDFGLSIIEHMFEELKELSDESGSKWLLASIDNPAIAQRFAMLDSGQFSEVAFVKGDLNSMNIHYTNSCHVSSEAKLPFFEKQRLESPFYNLSSGGMMETINVEKRKPEDLRNLTDDMLKANTGYWSFSP